MKRFAIILFAVCAVSALGSAHAFSSAHKHLLAPHIAVKLVLQQIKARAVAPEKMQMRSIPHLSIYEAHPHPAGLVALSGTTFNLGNRHNLHLATLGGPSRPNFRNIMGISGTGLSRKH